MKISDSKKPVEIVESGPHRTWTQGSTVWRVRWEPAPQKPGAAVESSDAR